MSYLFLSLDMSKIMPYMGFPRNFFPFSALFLSGLMAWVLSACISTGVPDAPIGGAEILQDAALLADADTLPDAVRESYALLSKDLKDGSRMAVISVASEDIAEGEFTLEELNLLLVNSKKFRMVDRRSLDAIRAEQNFQLSGEVDDDTAVSIGHLIGAEMVITGSITPYGTAKYLRIKALDVETGEIRAMTSQRYNRFL
ncbi:hypothetical protein FACS1894110_07500 [Spirochaetia bacterium]|nr:hypothetical protein FACS1894110_07500 [Spirochaetia bacterium]